MKKIIFVLCSILLFVSCSYYTVKDAVKVAEKGNYIQALNTISSHMYDGYPIEAFESVYIKAESTYKSQIRNKNNINLLAYTKALSNLLKIQDIYFKLPEKYKIKMKLLPSTFEDTNEIKKELANSFYKLGKQSPNNTYFDKLHTYGLFKMANIYNIGNKKDITKALETSMHSATGIFLISVNSNFNSGISSTLYSTIEINLLKYPIFKIGTSSNYNILFNVSTTNFSYVPSDIKAQSGTGSYETTVAQNVMKKIVETKYVDGKKIETTKWTPTFEDVKVKVEYRYVKYIKTSSISFDLGYNIYEKNGNSLYTGLKKIKVDDKVEWTEYYPLKSIVGVSFSEHLRSEPEKFNISREQLMEKAKFETQKEMEKIIETLYSNQKISL